MKTVLGFDLENPWFFLFTSVVIWVVISVYIETTFFNGEFAKAVITGGVGGLACGVGMLYMRQGNKT